jgi:hypothetical protein
VDLDERWWIDLLLDEQAPEVRTVAMGTRVFIDGFETTGGRMIARKTSIQGADLADWPADTPLVLHPAVDACRS